MSKVEKLLRPEIETFRFDLRLPNELDPMISSIFRKKSTCFDWPALERHHAIPSVMSHHWWVIFADQFGHDIQLVICILYIEYILNDSQMFKKISKISIFQKIQNTVFYSTLTKYRTLQIDFCIEMIILNF